MVPANGPWKCSLSWKWLHFPTLWKRIKHLQEMSLVKWFFEGHKDCRSKKEEERERIRKEGSGEGVKRSHGLLGQHCCFHRRSTKTSLTRKKRKEWEECDILYSWISLHNRLSSYTEPFCGVLEPNLLKVSRSIQTWGLGYVGTHDLFSGFFARQIIHE